MAWTDNLPVIRAKIHNVSEAQQLSGYQPKPNIALSPLLTILPDLFHMGTDVYRRMIVAWMEEHVQHHASAKAWWETHGQDWTYYKTILQAGCVPDGLEIWVVSQASGVHLNFIQRGQVWSSYAASINRDDITLMYLENRVVFCDRLDSDTISKALTHIMRG